MTYSPKEGGRVVTRGRPINSSDTPQELGRPLVTVDGSGRPHRGIERGTDRLVGRHRQGRTTTWGKRLPLLPAVVFMLLTTQVPLGLTIWYSLENWSLDVPGSAKYIGFANYANAIHNPVLLTAALNTIELTIGVGTVSAIIATGVALLLNRRIVASRAVRSLIVAPFFVMTVAGALTWSTLMYDPVYGTIDYILNVLGLHNSFPWLTRLPLLSIGVVLVWKWMPFMMLIIYAGLRGQDIDQLEAASVDGAGSTRKFVYITLPYLRPYIELALLLGTVFLLQTFGAIYAVTQGGPGFATTNLAYLVYETVITNSQVSSGAAIGILTVIGVTFVAVPLLRVLTVFMKGPAR